MKIFYISAAPSQTIAVLSIWSGLFLYNVYIRKCKVNVSLCSFMESQIKRSFKAKPSSKNDFIAQIPDASDIDAFILFKFKFKLT